MNMNNFPRGFEHATESKPLPRWIRRPTRESLMPGRASLLSKHSTDGIFRAGNHDSFFIPISTRRL